LVVIIVGAFFAVLECVVLFDLDDDQQSERREQPV